MCAFPFFPHGCYFKLALISNHNANFHFVHLNPADSFASKHYIYIYSIHISKTYEYCDVSWNQLSAHTYILKSDVLYEELSPFDLPDTSFLIRSQSRWWPTDRKNSTSVMSKATSSWRGIRTGFYIVPDTCYRSCHTWSVLSGKFFQLKHKTRESINEAVCAKMCLLSRRQQLILNHIFYLFFQSNVKLN